MIVPSDADSQDSPPITTKNVTDCATGVLVLALRVPPRTALERLRDAARRHGVALAELAEAVVIVASGGLPRSPGHWDVLSEEWGDLLH